MNTPDDIAAALSGGGGPAGRRGADHVERGHDPEPRAMAALALQQRLPAMFMDRVFVEAGGLLSYGANTTATERVGRDVRAQDPERVRTRPTCRWSSRPIDFIVN